MDVIILIARLSLSAVFLVSAYDKTVRFKEAQAEFRAAKVPLPSLISVLVIVLHWLGSLALISGIYASYAAYVLAAFILLATIWVHKFWLKSGQERVDVTRAALANLAIFGGLLLSGVVGPGKYVLI